MNDRVTQHGYQVNTGLYDFVNQAVLPGTGIEAAVFWQTLTDLLTELMPRNQALLAKRERLQRQIDDWHLDAANRPFDAGRYRQFLYAIGYINDQGDDFSISSENVDAEVATVAGPQLVVPLMNARYALNAANARWGSLYDALYGTDVIPHVAGAAADGAYDPQRGDKVIAFARAFLDQHMALADGSHADVRHYAVADGQLLATLDHGKRTGLKEAAQFVGYQGQAAAPGALLCVNHGLHVVIQIDATHPVGKGDKAGVKDVLLEAALSTIMDCEDSIAAVDGEDKVAVYRNWLGLMKGDLSESIEKNAETLIRTLNADHHYTAAGGAGGESITLPGRSLLFIRNVGHLMHNDAILTPGNAPVPEGILDAMITTLIALHDLNGNGRFRNSRSGSIYIVKPKMHGPEEVQFTSDLFGRIEQGLGLAANTIKMGIMDEERRTSVNLKACIRAAKARVVFINTGFLDRTGDEIHTAMQAGPVVRKAAMQDEKWIAAYEARNVRIGLRCGLQGRAQIGKGMWPVPDQMAQMMRLKSGQLQAGANCAWVPSPTAATLHALHYHQINVAGVQAKIKAEIKAEIKLKVQTSAPSGEVEDAGEGVGAGEETDSLTDLLTLPLLADPTALSEADIQAELDNNIQGLLGYVVRWVDQGIGCSKVPDIMDVGRMEDRATLRISSQHICNWLHHGILTEEQVMAGLKRMAAVVDGQNAGDKNYRNMAVDFTASLAFQAAVDLIFKGKQQPGGYTEPLLHQSRLAVKAR